MTYLPIRAEDAKAMTSISLGTVATAANTFLSRAAQRRGEEFIPWDADDVVGMCINLIDQVFCQSVNFRGILKDILRWDGGFWYWLGMSRTDLRGFVMLWPTLKSPAC
jgi:hypothetical protein